LPKDVLTPLLPPGLTLDAYEGWGFLAIAMVKTRRLRPAFLPAFLGRDFFLSGYRIFARHRTAEGRELRGLRILRSDTDSRWMTFFGNLLTHYNYRKCDVDERRTPDELQLSIATPEAEADLSLRARLSATAAAPPKGSPFPDLDVARRYAGPLPFTFDYERATHSIVMIQGVRSNWNPRPVEVEVEKNTFLTQGRFAGVPATLANAFCIEDIPYSWKRGVREKLPETAA
ncbi:MAG TPA: DUF2071 domain-containing protein, partial [Thermoanaerobaculia bacterium]|nr:DUF2071 domain-containing protein [Thermoanaerobaculia bacterium]